MILLKDLIVTSACFMESLPLIINSTMQLYAHTGTPKQQKQPYGITNMTSEVCGLQAKENSF